MIWRCTIVVDSDSGEIVVDSDSGEIVVDSDSGEIVVDSLANRSMHFFAHIFIIVVSRTILMVELLV